MIMIQMLHVNIFIVIGSLCAGLCDIAAALYNLYYVLQNALSTPCFFFSFSSISPSLLLQNVIDRSNGGVCRLRSLSISSSFSFSSFTVNYLHNCLAKSLRNTLHLFTEGRKKTFTRCFCPGFLSISATYRHTGASKFFYTICQK